MKFYTSYYGNYKNIPTDYYCVGISRYCPDGFKDNPDYKNFLFVKDNIFAPTKDLLEDMKSGNETEEGYKRRYVEHLLSQFGEGHMYNSFEDFINAISDNFSDKYQAIVFLCYEKPNDFCHRHILRNLMNRIFHIPCEELIVEEKKKETIQNQTTLF